MSSWASRSFGPGAMPWARNAPSKSAIDGEPGTPNASVGMSAPPSRALLADSAAIRPRTSPLPKVSPAPFPRRAAARAWRRAPRAPLPGPARRAVGDPVDHGRAHAGHRAEHDADGGGVEDDL